MMDNSINVTNSVTRHNYFIFMTTYIKHENTSHRRVAKVIGCSSSTVKRLADGSVWPTDKMLKQSVVMFEIGIDRYGRLTKTEKDQIAHAIVADGSGVEFANVTAAVNAVGVLNEHETSAEGMTSGLETIAAGLDEGLVRKEALWGPLNQEVYYAIPQKSWWYRLIEPIHTKYKEAKVTMAIFTLDPQWESLVPIEDKIEVKRQR